MLGTEECIRAVVCRKHGGVCESRCVCVSALMFLGQRVPLVGSRYRLSVLHSGRETPRKKAG